MASTFMQSIELDVQRALNEDLMQDPSIDSSAPATNDITAMLISEDAQASADIITRDDIILCGKAWAQLSFTKVDDSLELDWHAIDGQSLKANNPIVTIKGSARAILTAERTALNFLQMLSGTATTTSQYVKALQGSKTKLLDTRKTIPLYRQAQKYAVRCGGASNHRMGLFDAYLIKENHIAACGSLTKAIERAKQLQPGKPVEIEVEDLSQLQEAINANADIIMLDNFSTELVLEAVSINNGRCKLEVSGNITQERLKELAKTGIDYISSGAITKHIQAVDLSLLIS